MKTIVIARPPEDSEELAAAITAQGYRPLIEPVLTIETMDHDLPEFGHETTLVFTSANGVKAFAAKNIGRGNPVYTVGRNTADEARKAGFNNIETVAGAVDDLVNFLLKSREKEVSDLLYIRGTDVSKDLRQIMIQNGIQMREFIAYRSVPAENLSVNLLKRLDNREIEAIMFFSAKGGHVFAELAEQYDRAGRIRTTKALCISDAVLQSVSVLPFGERLVAEKPDRYGMIKLLERLPARN
jgi:uroporphyrinogen-III synthase